MKTCVFCETDFYPKSKNQKYCNPECCRKATNKKIMAKYYENKERLNGKKRICTSCNTVLSRYTSSEICLLCQKNKNSNNKTLILEALNFVAKQAK